VGAAHPLQEAAAVGLGMGSGYYQTLAEEYRLRKDFLLKVLEDVGFRVYRPNGAYYIMTDVAHFGFRDDVECAFYLVEKIGVATVPGSCFYSRPERGKTKVRFAFPKRMETLQQAAEKLKKFKPK
jgi:aminotransferase